ncbi:MAG: hypothetical protein WB677_18040 [Xanthobacteraceae bacterium]
MPHSKGVVKSCMLPGDICVTFSNSPELATRDFGRFSQLHPTGVGFSEVVSFFEQSSADTGNDYLLAFSRVPRIVKISEGRRVESVSKTLWVGDVLAFRRFRQAEKENKGRGVPGRAVNAVIFMDELEKSPASDLFSAMREVVADRHVSSVGGFVSVISNRDPGFRHSVYSDILFNWPEGKETDFILNLNDQIDFGASGENSEYAVAQISTGYLGMNIVAFYLLKPRKAFAFFGERNGLPIQCRVLDDVQPNDIARRLSEAVGFNPQWLLTIMAAAPDRTRSVERWPPRTEGPSGVGLPMFCHANTFPPTERKG